MNKKDTTQLVITAVLILILIGIIGHNFLSFRPPKVVPIAGKKEPPPKEAGGKDVQKAEGKSARLEEESRRLELKRDPFSRQPTQSSGPHLSGIAWDEKYPTAIINDTIVKIGDEIAGQTVIDIQKDKVILDDGLKAIELKAQTP